MVKKRDDRSAKADTLQLVEEQVELQKRQVVTGRVDVRTVTETINELVKTTVQDQTVEVTRVTINRQVDVAPSIRTDGDVTVIPVFEEIIVVEKRLLLKEEIRIRRITRSEDIETTVPLRRQRAVVERHEAGSTSDTTEAKV